MSVKLNEPCSDKKGLNTIPTFNDLEKESFSKHCGEKGENAGNQHFLLFPQCFLSGQFHKSSFELHLRCCLQLLSNWTGLKFCRLVRVNEFSWCILPSKTLLNYGYRIQFVKQFTIKGLIVLRVAWRVMGYKFSPFFDQIY